MQPAFIPILLLIFLLLMQRREKQIWIKQYIKSKKREDRSEMTELAKRFINKECIIYTFNSQLNGTVREVSSSAILLELEGGSGPEAVNLDYIVRIREHPRKKNGKKKSVVLD